MNITWDPEQFPFLDAEREVAEAKQRDRLRKRLKEAGVDTRTLRGLGTREELTQVLRTIAMVGFADPRDPGTDPRDPGTDPTDPGTDPEHIGLYIFLAGPAGSFSRRFEEDRPGGAQREDTRPVGEDEEGQVRHRPGAGRGAPVGARRARPSDHHPGGEGHHSWAARQKVGHIARRCPAGGAT
jgi:hypothetical protein